MSKTTFALVALLLAGTAQAQSAAEVAKLNQARYLAANCANCHGTQGRAQAGFFSLAGYPKEAFVAQMKAFRDGTRPATIMHQLAKGYSDEQIELMAEYFARQSRQ
ncbi:MAG: c-type cytochrome [Burkholderiales bacterium]